MTKRAVFNISCIYMAGNSSYRERFSGISALHIIAPGKSETHMIESVNSGIRDNLARFSVRHCEKL